METYANQNNNQAEAPVSEQIGSPFKKFLIPTLAVLTLVFIILFVSIAYFKNKNTKSPATLDKITPAESTDKTIAKVGAKSIYIEDLEKIAKEQYQESAINKKVLQISLNIAIERGILDETAKELSIVIPDSSDTSVFNTYDFIKEQITSKLVESRLVQTVGFWIPDLTYPQMPQFAKQRVDGEKALNEIERRLKSGENPLTVARDIYNKYPSLQPILGVNGYLLSKEPTISLINKPRIYIIDKKNKGQSFFDALFNANAGDIQKISNPASGGRVFKVFSVQHSEYSTYEEWLEAKKKGSVNIINNL